MIRNIIKNALNGSLKFRQCYAIIRRPACIIKFIHPLNQGRISNYVSFAFISLMYSVKAESINEGNNFSSNENIANQDILIQADELFSMGKFEESFELLKPFEDAENNVEMLWRLARALYNMSKLKHVDRSKSTSLIYKAHEYVDRALMLDDKHYAVHKWKAILYDAKCALEGIKARINALPQFKEHLLRAIELNPNDATSIYMLGQYMYSIADMSRFQLMLAKTLFGSPPEATFEEAFYYFSKAEEVEPNFYSANLLMLGKTCLKLKRIEAASFWLECARSYPVRTDEDEEVRLEAEELLKKTPGLKSKETKEEQTESS